VFLKTLTLKGFKSFADTTSLELEPGITVIVGPNGSGKSNVVDAISWVLGAQGPSTVRSSKMDDVIFAGTSGRQALGRAEVALTIDNSAGLLPIEFNELTISRTLFRNGDSEYAINGVPCRLLDIQELLSDSGVGRQQHVIVSQGQIDAVLNARPEERRLIIEEAAGVLKYRRRKEKAERRLQASEANLLRLQDLLREVRRQLRPLQRQAEAARRHGDLVQELHDVRVHLAGRELEVLQRRLGDNARVTADVGGSETALKAQLSQLDASVMATEAQLSATGGDDLGDALMRFESLREKARGLAALLAERRRGIERERGAFLDQAVVATLEAESARLRDDLRAVEDEAEALVPMAADLAEAEAALEDDRQRFQREWGDAIPAPGGRAAEVRGELAALRQGVDRTDGERGRIQSRLDALTDKATRLTAETDRLRAELGDADAAERPLAAALEEAEATRAQREAELAAAEAAVRSADADRHAWEARIGALALALDEARAKAGAARLAEVGGVVGTLLDLVEVDEGWEKAFEAAAGEALAAVVVDGVDAARRALAAIHADDGSGAVLALGIDRFALHAPPAGEPIRRHVRSSQPGVSDLLDALLATAVVIDGDWSEAVDLVLRHPDAVVVTRQGDRLGPAGWQVGAGRAGVTRAALEEARAKHKAAVDTSAAAEERLVTAKAAVDGARQAEHDLSRQLDANDGRLSAAGDALQRLESERRDVATEQEALRSHLAELAERGERDRARVAELETGLAELEAEEAQAAAQIQRMQAARSRIDDRAAAVGAIRTDLEVRAAAVEQRRIFLQRRLGEVDERLERDAVEREQAATLREELDRRLVATDRLAALVTARLEVVERELADLRDRRRRQSEETRRVSERLDLLRRERAGAEKQLEEVRERARRAELEGAELKLRLETAVEALRRDLDCEPAQAIAAECPPLPEGITVSVRVRELERELRLLGPINPLALEEYEQLQERHGFLEAQLEDVKSTRRDLSKVIKAVDEEIVNVFSAAYADVSANFEALFETLFPGGSGGLRLTEPDNLLDTGIEVEARPSGKNVRKLSLLSGGERSLTALAYLFAVFRSRPSPFYVMDEVEAALDDVNLHRFLDLIHEFREEAQLLVVSHQKRTMEAADCLYGVTMQPGGSSRVVSERVTV